MHQDFEIGPEFVGSLGVAGTQGTIAFRMRNTPAERRLRAKTGTLRGVSALSGYVVDPDNRTLIFSILAQGFSGSTSTIWKVQNQIGEALASGGESWLLAQQAELEENDSAQKGVSTGGEASAGGNP